MMHFTFRIFTGALLSVLIFTYGCRQIKSTFDSKTPREKYVDALRESPLVENKIVQQWLAEGDLALKKPVPVEAPFQSRIVYFSDEPNTWSWSVSMPEGRKFYASLTESGPSHKVFVSLFALKNGTPEFVETMKDSVILYTPEKDQTLIIRIQAELLVNGSATFTLTGHPSMEFPVAGADLNDIGGVYGDPRAGGDRIHKGVDIFADRGTPVLAVSEGRIRQAGDSHGIGGITVWLRTNGKSVYYAHLDSVHASAGQRVQKGDTLGFVGNSGNASTTPPHLHFGIYDYGAVNPLPFIKFADTRIEPITVNLSSFPKWGRVASDKANVRPLPSTKKAPVLALSQHNPVKITGATGGWYQIELPGGMKGFIYQSLIEQASFPIETSSLEAGNFIFNTFTSKQPILRTDSSQTLEIFGAYNNRQLARFQNDWVWIEG